MFGVHNMLLERSAQKYKFLLFSKRHNKYHIVWSEDYKKVQKMLSKKKFKWPIQLTSFLSLQHMAPEEKMRRVMPEREGIFTGGSSRGSSEIVKVLSLTNIAVDNAVISI